MNNSQREYIKKQIREILDTTGFIIGATSEDHIERAARRVYGKLKGLEIDVDILEEEITSMYLRNGQFPGDLMGRPDDDLLDYDDDDDDENEGDEEDDADDLTNA